MEGADALGLIAEIGIAIVGFTAVVAALRAPDGRIGAYAAIRIGGLLGQSATVVLVALLPFGLHHTGLGSNTIWALASSVMALLNLSVMLISVRASRRVIFVLPEEDRSPGIRRSAPQ